MTSSFSDTPDAAWGDKPIRHDSPWGKEVSTAQKGLAQAQKAHAAATDARALAVWRARQAGVPLRRIGAWLGGMAHKNVLALERRGAEIAAARSHTPDMAWRPTSRRGRLVVVEAPTVAGERCLREGCPFPQVPGRRFCEAHQWN